MALKDTLKSKFCGRSLEAGDIVRLPEGKGEAVNHPLGGRGHWGIFVKKDGAASLVRPLDQELTPGKPVKVEHPEHIDDVLQDTALKFYKEEMSKRRGTAGSGRG